MNLTTTISTCWGCFWLRCSSDALLAACAGSQAGAVSAASNVSKRTLGAKNRPIQKFTAHVGWTYSSWRNPTSFPTHLFQGSRLQVTQRSQKEHQNVQNFWAILLWVAHELFPPKTCGKPRRGNTVKNPLKGGYLVIQSDLFGMVKWPFGKVKWPPTMGWKGHFESPGIWIYNTLLWNT